MPTYCLSALLGLGLAFVGVTHGGSAWVLLWLGVGFLLLAFAQAKKSPAILGKRASGTLAPWSWALFLPLHLYTLGIWHLYRLINREAATHSITPTLIIGRRLLAKEIPPGLANYIDLTAEFTEPATCRAHPGYQTFPILDASTPDADRLQELFGRLRPGPTYIHCAQGHGRTGLVAASYLLFTGQAQTTKQAVEMLRSARPGLRLNNGQSKFVDAFAAAPPSRL